MQLYLTKKKIIFHILRLIRSYILFEVRILVHLCRRGWPFHMYMVYADAFSRTSYQNGPDAPQARF